MAEIELTEQQKTDVRSAIAQWRLKNNALNELDMDDREKQIERLKLAKTFLDENQDVAFHYHCSGRGLPALSYHSRIELLRLYQDGHEDYEHLVDDEYLAKIAVNIERYKANIEALSKSN